MNRTTGKYTVRLLVQRGIRRRWRGMTALSIIMLLEVAISVFTPWPMRWLIDNVLNLQPRTGAALQMDRQTLLWLCAGGTVLAFVATSLLNLVQSWISVGVGQAMVYDLSADLFAHVQRLSLKVHARSSVGDTLKRITGDCGCVATILRDCLLPMIASALSLLAMFAILLTLDWQLALVSIAAAPLLLLLVRKFSASISERSYEYAEAEAGAYETIDRTLARIPLVQAFFAMDANDAALRAVHGRAIAAALRANASHQLMRTFTGTVTAIATAMLVYLGARRVLSGALTTGELWVFLAYLASMYWPLESLIDSTAHVRDATGSARRVLEVLNQAQDVIESPIATALRLRDNRAPHVRFNDVSFSYDPGRDVLHEITLDVEPGETVGLVGESGGGKTTLMSLIPRLYDPRSGSVAIDGQDLRDLKLADLRRNISMVMQRAILFPISIADNIAYARSDATRSQIEAAARAAHADEFIQQLPEGYDTIIGERGSTLSGGQRQRISIARALLHDAPILILDEPTSALDGESEEHLLAGLTNLIKGKTTFIIAHRFSTLKLATRIILIDRGRISEQGSHDHLLQQNGQYARLWKLQFDPEVQR